jgi:hypothetical protein
VSKSTISTFELFQMFPDAERGDLPLEGGHAIAPVKPGAQTEMFDNYF